MLYAFFWVIPQRLNVLCRRFGTPCSIVIGGQVWRMTGFENVGVFIHINTPTFSNLVILHTCPSMMMEQTECSEMLAYNIQTPGNYPEESVQPARRWYREAEQDTGGRVSKKMRRMEKQVCRERKLEWMNKEF